METNSHSNNNNKINYAIEYHEETKHSELSLQMSHHYLDFDNKPRPFKIYLDLPSIALPGDFPIPKADALTCIRSVMRLKKKEKQKEGTRQQPTIDIRVLAQLLFFSAGITREMKFDSDIFYMRAASATGALYPIELYVISEDISGLSAGVYHFGPGDFSLTKLRGGDFRGKLAAMAGDNHDILTSPVTIAFTSLAWRNSWKYGARSYRHWFWDSGVIAANLLAVAIAMGLRASLVMGFIDSMVNNLLLLEQRKEAAIVLAPIIMSRSSSLAKISYDLPQEPNLAVPVAEVPRILPISKKQEIEYSEIWKLHEASSLTSKEEVIGWLLHNRMKNNNFNQEEAMPNSLESKEEVQEEEVDLYHDDSSAQQGINSLQAEDIVANRSIGNVILRRGSSRRFSHSAISKNQLTTILYSSTRGVPLDFKKTVKDSLVDVYLIANAVVGLTPGHYFYDQNANSLIQLKTKKESASRDESGYLCLGQPLFSDASAVFFLMMDLGATLKAFGNRGYRASQFEAGVVAGKIYLASYAQGLGASGSTFFDDAVTETFSPHAKDKATMIAVGVGIPPYRAHPGKILAARLTKSELLSSW